MRPGGGREKGTRSIGRDGRDSTGTKFGNGPARKGVAASPGTASTHRPAFHVPLRSSSIGVLAAADHALFLKKPSVYNLANQRAQPAGRNQTRHFHGSRPAPPGAVDDGRVQTSSDQNNTTPYICRLLCRPAQSVSSTYHRIRTRIITTASNFLFYLESLNPFAESSTSRIPLPIRDSCEYGVDTSLQETIACLPRIVNNSAPATIPPTGLTYLTNSRTSQLNCLVNRSLPTRCDSGLEGT